MSEKELAFLELTAHLSEVVEDFKLACIVPLWSQVKALEAINTYIQKKETSYEATKLTAARAKVDEMLNLREGLLAEAILAIRN